MRRPSGRWAGSCLQASAASGAGEGARKMEHAEEPRRERVDFGPVSVYLGLQKGKYPDCNQMIVNGAARQVAVDASRTTHLIADHFDRSDLILLSHLHEDHIAGLKRLPDVPVEVHEKDLPALQSWEGLCDAAGHAPELRAAIRAEFERDFDYAPRPEAKAYHDGTVWDLGGVTLRAIATPGHTAGHCSILVEEEGLLFLGDIDLSSFGPFYGDEGSSIAEFRATLAKLPGIPAKTWVTGHHKAIYTERDAFLRDLAAYGRRIDARDEKLLGHLREGPQSLEALVERRLLYPKGFAALYVEGIERRVIRRHLDGLIAQGRAAEEEGIFRAL